MTRLRNVLWGSLYFFHTSITVADHLASLELPWVLSLLSNASHGVP